MNRRDFNDLVNWLANRPEAAKRLVAALGIDAPVAEEPVLWVTAGKAGKAIGMSGKWVKEHLDWFPSAQKVARGSRYAWMFDLSEVRRVWSSRYKQ